VGWGADGLVMSGFSSWAGQRREDMMTDGRRRCSRWPV